MNYFQIGVMMKTPLSRRKSQPTPSPTYRRRAARYPCLARRLSTTRATTWPHCHRSCDGRQRCRNQIVAARFTPSTRRPTQVGREGRSARCRNISRILRSRSVVRRQGSCQRSSHEGRRPEQGREQGRELRAGHGTIAASRFCAFTPCVVSRRGRWSLFRF